MATSRGLVGVATSIALGGLVVFGAQRVALRSPTEASGAPQSSLASRAEAGPTSPRPGERPGADRQPQDAARWPAAGLGRRPVSETEEDFRRALWNPDLLVEMKVALIEMLADYTPQASELLAELAADADDPELRLAAVEAIALLDAPAGARAALPGLLDTETSPEVRAELYSTLAFDAGETYAHAAPAELAATTRSETDSGARLQGFRLVASMLRFDASGELAETFDREMVPWLSEEALRGDSRYARLVAVDSLKIAGTDSAGEALRAISGSPDPDAADAAARALFAQARLRD